MARIVAFILSAPHPNVARACERTSEDGTAKLAEALSAAMGREAEPDGRPWVVILRSAGPETPMRTKIEHGEHAGEPDRPRFGIETVEDYELATQRIAALQDSTRGDEEEHELQTLIEAVKRWDAKHDDATGWKD
jgi:hypothetical protein